ncbi:hypothetical protein U1Q18_002860 [Sarracenia purpurea var. burkii]
MDQDQPPPSTPRKVRFAPKAPSLRKPKPPDRRTEVVDIATGDGEAAESSLHRAIERLRKQGPKVEKKSPVQVAFAHETASSASMRTYGGMPREVTSGKNKSSGLQDAGADDGQILFSLPSADEPDETTGSSVDAMDASYQKKEKAYKEPWDYEHTNYPITLPWRKPYSGDPELLDETEFGDTAINMEYDENTMNPALELGLLAENDKPQMLFFHFPANLPRVTQERTESSKPLGSKGGSASAKGKERAGKSTSIGDTGASAAVKEKEVVGSSMPLEMGNASNMCCSLEELPGGYMGKMLVYKSGAIKWKLGDVIYDVSPGVKFESNQDVVAINTVDNNCCNLGKLTKRAVVTPDIDSLLDDITGSGSGVDAKGLQKI